MARHTTALVEAGWCLASSDSLAPKPRKLLLPVFLVAAVGESRLGLAFGNSSAGALSQFLHSPTLIFLFSAARPGWRDDGGCQGVELV